MDFKFRSATFGGFHKQDVLDFLESNAQEHAAQLAAEQKKLEESESERTRLDKECADAKVRIEELEGELREAWKERDECSAELEGLRVRNREQESELERLRTRNREQESEVERLRADVARLAPDAEIYAAVKERTAGVELRALRRAQEIQEQAREQVRQLRQDAQHWLTHLQQEYAALRTQTKDAALHAAAELEQAKNAVEQMERLIDERDSAMEKVVQAYQQAENDKIPAPMPISEE